MDESRSADDCLGAYSGYDDTACGGELYVATRRPVEDWLGCFVHEYCHFLQAIDIAAGRPMPFEITTAADDARFWAAVEGKGRLSKSALARTGAAIRAYEVDADHRAIELIKAHRLGLDRHKYIRDANAYHVRYTHAIETGRWYSGSETRERVTRLERAMPHTWLTDWSLTPEWREILEGG